jgi:hypothetical protein
MENKILIEELKKIKTLIYGEDKPKFSNVYIPKNIQEQPYRPGMNPNTPEVPSNQLTINLAQKVNTAYQQQNNTPGFLVDPCGETTEERSTLMNKSGKQTVGINRNDINYRQDVGMRATPFNE